jgi:hypothetical protein
VGKLVPIDRNYATEQMNLLILGGFRPPEEIEQIIMEECFRPEDVAEGDAIWVGQEVARAWAAKLEDERSWLAETDVDKLDAAFAALRACRIIALHQAGMERSDGLTEVSHEYDAAGAEASGVVGYCFYHQQDVERAIAGHYLLLAFGDIDGDRVKGEEIGRRIAAAIEQSGLRLSWDGTIDRCIGIDLRWQKRYRPPLE